MVKRGRKRGDENRKRKGTTDSQEFEFNLSAIGSHKHAVQFKVHKLNINVIIPTHSRPMWAKDEVPLQWDGLAEK